MKESLYGHIVIKPHPPGRVIWSIAVGVNPDRHDIDLVDSAWAYMSEVSARNAAIRWADRLGIILSEDEICRCCGKARNGCEIR